MVSKIVAKLQVVAMPQVVRRRCRRKFAHAESSYGREGGSDAARHNYAAGEAPHVPRAPRGRMPARGGWQLSGRPWLKQAPQVEHKLVPKVSVALEVVEKPQIHTVGMIVAGVAARQVDHRYVPPVVCAAEVQVVEKVAEMPHVVHCNVRWSP